MYSLPDSADEAQQPAHERSERTRQIASEAVIALIALAGSTLIVHRLLSAGGDEFQLHILHGSVRVLQSVARFAGTWALNAENNYNEYVNTLH